MRDFDIRFGLGSLLVSLGAAYILRNMYATQDFFFTFLGIFFLLEGFYNVIGQIARKEKGEATQNLSLAFIGISILLFEFSLITYSTILLIALIIGSIGLAMIISGSLFNYSQRNIFIGIILIIIGGLLFIPIVFNISNSVYRIVRDYGIGIVLIALGVAVFLPKKKGE